MQMEEYGRERGFILKAPAPAGEGAQFGCPDSQFVEELLQTFPGPSSYKVTSDGRLHGYDIYYNHQRARHVGDFSWDNDKFCVTFADEDEDYDTDGVFQFAFNACLDTNCPGPSQAHLDFLSYFNPISLCISIFFLLLTIVVFVWYKNINQWDRSNMMKIAFMVNLTIAYILG